MSSANAMSVLGTEPEVRTPEEYWDEIDEWEAETRASWVGFLDDAAAAAWPCARVRVRNLCTTFMEGVEVKIHLDGPVEALSRVDVDVLTNRLPEPPRPWGPRPVHPPWISGQLPNLHDFALSPPSYRPELVAFTNSGSVDLRLTLKELRPNATYDSDDDDDEFVLVIRAPGADCLTGTWTATARDHHELFEGELVIDVAEVEDLSPIVERLLPDR
ncbi:hypothetical protein [Rhodococcus sp. ACT016]|uniref:hypothetical protein n=1 Tax=Rhodococcus sp. ACT016 TaxID=3134808 RepID=UPI003D26A7AF